MNVTIIMCYVVKQVFVDIMMTFAEVESYHGTNLGSLVGLKWNKRAIQNCLNQGCLSAQYLDCYPIQAILAISRRARDSR